MGAFPCYRINHRYGSVPISESSNLPHSPDTLIKNTLNTDCLAPIPAGSKICSNSAKKAKFDPVGGRTPRKLSVESSFF